jgi:Nif-specific regulatory protein
MIGSVPTNSTAISLVSLYEISKMLSSSLDLERTLLDILNLLASYLQMRRGTIAIKKSDSHALTILAAAGMAPEAVRKGDARLPLAVARSTVSSGMPYVVQDVASEPDLADHAGLLTLGADERISLIAVPLKSGGKPFGVLIVDRIWGAGASVNFEADVRLLVMVANLIGQTLALHQHIAEDRRLLMDESCRRQDAARAATGAGSGRRCQMQAMTGGSRPMQALYAEIDQAAPTRSTVMIRGESGTGKELIARAIHTLSKVKDGPFIRVNCAALPEGLLESELFGHEKGAFTGATQDRKGRFELAHGGTLFLDEIGEISMPFQAKLLRVLQEGEFERVGGMKTVKVKVRLICATNRNLEEAVAQGRFRGDLYYRINVVPIFVPALRNRQDDIPMLAEAFLARFNEENERRLRFAPRAMHVLTTCKFPGNVRELENCINRAATMTRGDVIEDMDLACQTDSCLSRVLWLPNTATTSPTITNPATRGCESPSPTRRLATAPAASNLDSDYEGDGEDDEFDEPDDLRAGPELPQRQRLIRAMEKAGWVQAKAARLLDLTPRQLGYALRKYNIEIKRL